MSGELIVAFGVALGGAAATMAVAAVAARRQGRVVVVDVGWGLGFVVIALASGAVATALDRGDSVRSLILIAIVSAWGARLGVHVGLRTYADDHEDPRYLKVLGGPLTEVGMGVAVRKVFVVQGLAMAVIATPIWVGTTLDVEWWPVVVAGVIVWLVGLVFETVGDAQLATYRSAPRESRPAVLDTGLWRYTRHPNYFGDAAAWWGIWLVGGAASGWVPALATVIAPVAMTWFIIAATGVRMTEENMMKRPAYREYAKRTSMFVPLPPRS